MSNNAIEPTLADRARELQALADVLLPGDGHFPPASAVGDMASWRSVCASAWAEMA